MRQPKFINYPDVKVIMRKDFYDEFDDQLKKIAKDTGATFFAHGFIKNYREKDHKVSTFCNFEPWHEVYWDKYRNDDPLERTINQAVQKNDFGVISWDIGHNSSPCSQERLKLTKAKDGITFSFKRPENYIETLYIGWNELDSERLDTDYILHLTSLLKPIRDYHWQVHDKVV